MNAEVQAEVTRQNAERGLRNKKAGEGFELRRLAREKRMPGTLNACRSAGSRGLFDVMSFHRTYVKCVICKTNGYIEPAQREALKKFFRVTLGDGVYRLFIHSKNKETRRIEVKRVWCENDIR